MVRKEDSEDIWRCKVESNEKSVYICNEFETESLRKASVR